jgi:hypothetical protein
LDAGSLSRSATEETHLLFGSGVTPEFAVSYLPCRSCLEKRMNLRLFAAVALCLLIGCSRQQTVSVLGLRWEIGQHQDCIYKAKNLYCIPAGANSVAGYQLTNWKTRDGKPVPRNDALLLVSVDLTRSLDRNRSETERDKDAETGVYDTKFSTSPPDYSIWDCFKTGQGSPAISCTLTKKAEGEKEKKSLARQIEDGKLDDAVRALSQDDLIRKCGQPGQVTSDSISRTLHYQAASGLPIAFRFDTLGHGIPLLDEATSEEPRDEKAARKIFWWKSSPLSSFEAEMLAKEMPCLKQ